VPFFRGTTVPSVPGPPHYRGFMISHTTVGTTPLDEWSARRRDLYLITRNTNKRQTSMAPAGFEPAIPASERPQTQALGRAAAAIGVLCLTLHFFFRPFVHQLKSFHKPYIATLHVRLAVETEQAVTEWSGDGCSTTNGTGCDRVV
jgi:hypothetical protein